MVVNIGQNVKRVRMCMSWNKSSKHALGLKSYGNAACYMEYQIILMFLRKLSPSNMPCCSGSSYWISFSSYVSCKYINLEHVSRYRLLLSKYLDRIITGRHAVTQLVEALCYMSEGRGLDSRWCQ
jgi:hypothetical protein